MIKYNLLMRDENEGILKSIFDTANGKLIISSDNSFAISSILEELKVAAWSGEFELYNGSIKVNPDVTSENVIIAVCTQMTYSMPKVTSDFKVANLTRESRESFVFNIIVLPIEASLEFGDTLGTIEKVSDVPEVLATRDDETEIFNSLRVHNVVFIQDLNTKVVKGVKDKREDVKEINSINTISEGYSITADDGVIVFNFDAPESFTLEHNDCVSFISSSLRYGVTIMCNTTWVRFFLEFTSMEDGINMSSVVVYNNSVFGPMGNAGLYTVND